VKVRVFEDSVGRGLVFETPDGRRDITYLRFKDRDAGLRFAKSLRQLLDR